MRLALLLCLVPALAQAEDVTLAAPITEAVIFQRGAVVTREATAALPEGQHRLLVPVMPNGQGLPRITLSGARLGAVSVLRDALVDGRSLRDPAQVAAAAALEAAETARDDADDARIAAGAGIDAAEARIAFLRSISGAALTQMQDWPVRTTAEAIGGGIATARTELAAARAAFRAAEEAVAEAVRAEDQARRDLDATGVTDGPVTLLAVGLTSDGGPVALRLDQVTAAAGWTPDYVADLGGGTVRLDRRAVLRQGTGLPMRDVTLRLSSADLFAAIAPTPLFPDQITTDKESYPSSSSVLRRESAQTEGFALDAPAPAPVVAEAVLDGPVVTYDYPAPVTLGSQDGPLTVPLDTLDLPARAFNRAVPRRDATAFLMAALSNDTGEPILPGPVSLLREGTPIGEGALPLVPAGDDADLAFGPQPHLRLDWVALDNEEGERGIFSTQGTRRQDVVMRVRNLSDTPERVETLYALPFSEQEAIDVTVRSFPVPDATDVEDRRGIARWDLSIAPGATAEITVRIEVDWPEGQTLGWQP